jgi:hypothetical protein
VQHEESLPFFFVNHEIGCRNSKQVDQARLHARLQLAKDLICVPFFFSVTSDWIWLDSDVAIGSGKAPGVGNNRGDSKRVAICFLFFFDEFLAGDGNGLL